MKKAIGFIVLILIVGLVFEICIRGCFKKTSMSKVSAIQTKNAGQPTVADQLKHLNELVEANPEDFCKDMKQFISKHPEMVQNEDLMVKYLYGVYLWHSGSKSQAIPLLRDVAEKIDLPCLNFVSGPIPTGSYRVNYSLEKQEDPWLEDNVMFIITAIEVSQSQDLIAINLTIRNHTNVKRKFIFPRVPGEVKTETKPDRNTDFFLVDDLGNKLFPINEKPYFGSAPGWQLNERWSLRNQIELEPGQEISERIIFPMVAPGSTSIRFGLPDQPETLYWHKGVTFDPIILWKIRFTKFPQSPRPPLQKSPIVNKTAPDLVRLGGLFHCFKSFFRIQ